MDFMQREPTVFAAYLDAELEQLLTGCRIALDAMTSVRKVVPAVASGQIRNRHRHSLGTTACTTSAAAAAAAAATCARSQMQQQQPPATLSDGTHDDCKLVILCLHGFRQNASQLRGRLRGLQRRLASVATLVFLDAPHVLPLWRKQQLDKDDRAAGSDGPSPDTPQQQQQQQQQGVAVPPGRAPAPRRAWLLSRELLEAQPQLQAMFAQLSSQQQAVSDGAAAAAAWEAAPADVAHDEQYSMQAHGWEASWQLLQQALRSYPRVDGLLGFSQGAAVAAAVAALQQQQQQQAHEGGSLPRLKFVVLASGFVSPAPEHRWLLQELGPLTLPSLHIFASAAGSDRQIQQQESERLEQCWALDRRRSIIHAGGHLIPCDRATSEHIKAFLLAHSGDSQV